MGVPSRFSTLFTLSLLRGRHSIVSLAAQKFLAGASTGVKQAVGWGVSGALPTDWPEFCLAENLVRFP